MGLGGQRCEVAQGAWGSEVRRVHSGVRAWRARQAEAAGSLPPALLRRVCAVMAAACAVLRVACARLRSSACSSACRVPSRPSSSRWRRACSSSAMRACTGVRRGARGCGGCGGRGRVRRARQGALCVPVAYRLRPVQVRAGACRCARARAVRCLACGAVRCGAVRCGACGAHLRLEPRLPLELLDAAHLRVLGGLRHAQRLLERGLLRRPPRLLRAQPPPRPQADAGEGQPLAVHHVEYDGLLGVRAGVGARFGVGAGAGAGVTVWVWVGARRRAQVYVCVCVCVCVCVWVRVWVCGE